MTRRTNIINNVILHVLTAATFLAVVIAANRDEVSIGIVLLYFLAGFIIDGFICTLLHELGHLIAGKCNGFAFVSMTVCFFRWAKEKKGISFNFVMMGDEAGYTEMVAKNTENLEKRFKRMTRGGLVTTIIPMLFGAVSFFFVNDVPLFVFVLWAMFCTVGVYMFFGDALPMTSGGAGNDGKVLYGLKKQDDDSKVIMSLLKIQSELYNGKTPSEIDESYYFDLPQLAEDDLNFAMLLSARYDYYLDKKDYENAKKVSDRLLSIIDYLPDGYENIVKTNALYNACTFDKNEERADDLMYELEKYLNRHNGSLEIRAKTAYLLYIRGEKNALDVFYEKGVIEANRTILRGQGIFERKLLEELKKDF